MKIDFTQPIRALDGNELKVEGDAVLTLAIASINGLMRQDETRNLSGSDMVKRWDLAKQIYDASEPIDLTPEQVALIRDCIHKFYFTPVVVGPAWAMLDSKA